MFTTTGRPCANLVSDQSPWCRAGHPSTPAVSDDALSVAPDRSDAGPQRPPQGVGVRRPGSRTRRATELIRQAMASEDADQLGLRAETVLGDCTTALALLGGPDASPAARAAVVQRFGRVGALLVLGYEERGRGRHLAPVHGYGSAEGSERADADAHLETLVQLFDQLDARDLYWLLCEIDEDEGFAGDPDGIDAHRWLHATYAVAARDGTPGAHRAYMCALDRVMRLVRPLVAS
ncbi:MAG TPA: hypothetical protein VMU64_08550 [Acidimicrobiales bacterium]|nr:hypothetical protein [Acidimicrobiales bacterium]